MSNRSIMFFSSINVLMPIIKEIERKYSIKYFPAGLFDGMNEQGYDSVDQFPGIGHPKIGDWNHDLKLMLMPANVNAVIREVPQKKGGIKFAIDQLANQTSICIQFGGTVKEGIFLAGTFGTAYRSDFALAIFKLFVAYLKKNFTAIGAYYVSKDAAAKLMNGWRLVTNDKLATDYDLKLQ